MLAIIICDVCIRMLDFALNTLQKDIHVYQYPVVDAYFNEDIVQ